MFERADVWFILLNIGTFFQHQQLMVLISAANGADTVRRWCWGRYFSEGRGADEYVRLYAPQESKTIEQTKRTEYNVKTGLDKYFFFFFFLCWSS